MVHYEDFRGLVAEIKYDIHDYVLISVKSPETKNRGFVKSLRTLYLQQGVESQNCSVAHKPETFHFMGIKVPRSSAGLCRPQNFFLLGVHGVQHHLSMIAQSGQTKHFRFFFFFVLYLAATVGEGGGGWGVFSWFQSAASPPTTRTYRTFNIYSTGWQWPCFTLVCAHRKM